MLFSFKTLKIRESELKHSPVKIQKFLQIMEKSILIKGMFRWLSAHTCCDFMRNIFFCTNKLKCDKKNYCNYWIAHFGDNETPIEGSRLCLSKFWSSRSSLNKFWHKCLYFVANGGWNDVMFKKKHAVYLLKLLYFNRVKTIF